MFAGTSGPVNTPRFVFLDPRGPRFYIDWERIAREVVGVLRLEAGKNPLDRDLWQLIGELSTRSDDFRTWWGAHDVHVYLNGVKRLRHPVVGDLELAHERMDLPGDPGLTIVTYSAEPGSASEDGLKLLSSWSATPANTATPQVNAEN
jgi:hypothetical protein